MDLTNKIFFKKHKRTDSSFLAEIKLNHPKGLNVLDKEMIVSLKNQLKKWSEDPAVSLIFIHGEGERAFCAGGDVKQIYFNIHDSKKNNKDPGLEIQDFFQKEYEMNYRMHNYSKPIVLWGHGFVMGGGLGLFMASSHPIVTESSKLSMPEISIGLFPDVGASYFLNQIQKNLGFYLALTGYRFNGTEALFLKVANLIFKDSDKSAVFQFLLNISFSNPRDFTQQIQDFQKSKSIRINQDNWIKNYENEIFKVVESKEIQTIYKNFKDTKIEDKKWLKNKDMFFKGSPTSAGVICEQLLKGEKLSLKEVFKMELVMAIQFARHFDFQEGVRALLVEKTGSPAWKVDSIPQLKKPWIEDHFKSLSGWTNPLDQL
ncbi:MAG: enoyl-CoA hydratase/isomerase family protein [Bdellovibrionales bacterium]